MFLLFVRFKPPRDSSTCVYVRVCNSMAATATHAGSKRKSSDEKDEKQQQKATATSIGEGVLRVKSRVAALVAAANTLASSAAMRDALAVDVACQVLDEVTARLEAATNKEVFYVTAGKGDDESRGWCVYWRRTLESKELEQWVEFQIKLDDEGKGQEEFIEAFHACGSVSVSEFKEMNWNGNPAAPEGTLVVREVKDLCSLEEFKETNRGFYGNDAWQNREKPGYDCRKELDSFHDDAMLEVFSTPTPKKKQKKPTASA